LVMPKKYTAQCACGACKFGFDTDPTFVANCHCLDCKRASGGESATFMAVPQTDFQLYSGSPGSFKYVADSGNTLYRNFCPNCASRIFTDRLGGFPGAVFVMLGSLDRSDLIKPTAEIFTKRRLKWVKPLDIPQYSGMPG